MTRTTATTIPLIKPKSTPLSDTAKLAALSGSVTFPPLSGAVGLMFPPLSGAVPVRKIAKTDFSRKKVSHKIPHATPSNTGRIS